jgi:hypothetical protein
MEGPAIGAQWNFAGFYSIGPVIYGKKRPAPSFPLFRITFGRLRLAKRSAEQSGFLLRCCSPLISMGTAWRAGAQICKGTGFDDIIACVLNGSTTMVVIGRINVKGDVRAELA